jgi:hypothetical protein
MSAEPRVPPRAPGNIEPVHADVAYDHTDVKPRSVLAFLFYLALGLAAIFLIAWGSLRLIESRTARFDSPPSPVRQGVQKDIPPEPRLQGVPAHRTDPQQDLREMRAKDEADLNSYAWVDRQNGIARIPIKEAMKIIVEKGVPSSEAKPAAKPAEKK